MNDDPLIGGIRHSIGKFAKAAQDELCAGSSEVRRTHIKTSMFDWSYKITMKILANDPRYSFDDKEDIARDAAVKTFFKIDRKFGTVDIPNDGYIKTAIQLEIREMLRYGEHSRLRKGRTEAFDEQKHREKSVSDVTGAQVNPRLKSNTRNNEGTSTNGD